MSSIEELEEELMFQDVLASSLDPGADDYEAKVNEIEATKRELQQKLERLEASEREQADGLLRPASAASQPAQDASRSSSSSSTMSAAGTKRPRPESLSNLQSAHPYKRPTPEPSLAGTPASSVGSFELPDKPTLNPTATERAKQRQLQVEAAMKRRHEEQSKDEQFARHLSQPRTSIPTAGPSSHTRPSYQATLNHSGSFDRPPPSSQNVGKIEPRGSAVKNEYPASSSVPRYSQQPTPKVKPEPHSAMQTLPLPRNTGAPAVIDLTAESDDDVAEVAPPARQTPRPAHLARMPLPSEKHLNNSFRPPPAPNPYNQMAAPPPYKPLPPYNPGPVASYQPMPGAYPSADPNHAVYDMKPPAYTMQTGRSPVPDRSGSALGNIMGQVNNAASRFSSDLNDLNTLIRGSSSRPFRLDEDDDDSAGFPLDSAGLYAGHEDLFSSRYEEIQNHDPAKTREEINALLDNIRPDEDLPDELLVHTPEAMVITLKKYQELGLTWLKNCEEGSNKGGILGDDMGLGKTIQMLSLIVTRKSDNPAIKTTLIIAPVALLRQWKEEIQRRIKPGKHALTVHIHHGQGKKKDFRDLRVYDVVLTTFGSIGSELRKMQKFRARQAHDAGARPNSSEKCPLIGPDSQWFRVVLDEAQNIKNKSTNTAKAACMINAQYRFCMTGTPMMNNVNELHSLIHFLRIKPYNQWDKFRMDFTNELKDNRADDVKERAMKKLQALCKAIMLRRTKKSTYEGKPILVLPPRTTNIDYAPFEEHQQELYTALENKTQAKFNRYMKAGTVMQSYAHVLVLLLRLRQACCHPFLIRDLSISAAADVPLDTLAELAKELTPQVVNRIKETEGNFECPVCMDACTNPAIFFPCGHDTCSDCFSRIVEANANGEGQEQARCPECRGNINPKKITDFNSFKKIHMPELLTEEERRELEGDEDSETESDSDTDSDDFGYDTEEDDTLNGFIVKDDIEDSETESEAEEVKGEFDGDDTAGPVAKRSKKLKDKKPKDKAKPKMSKKAKGKKKAKELTLAELKKLSRKNAASRKKYLRKLRKDFVSSSKIDQTVALLKEIMEGKEGEKVLVFSQWTSLLDLVEIPIDEMGWGYRRYDGEMSAGIRADAVDDFKDSRKNVRIMLVSLKAGNAGLNLNIASRVIILDPFWNPYIEEQAIDRAHRLGQERPVQVHRILVEETVEDRIIKLQEKKRAIIETALDEASGKSMARLGAQELAYLFGVTRNVNDTIQYQERRRR